MDGLARRCQVSYRHLCYVFAGQRAMTAALYAAIQQALGESAWLWVTGQTDLLRDEESDHAAA